MDCAISECFCSDGGRHGSSFFEDFLNARPNAIGGFVFEEVAVCSGQNGLEDVLFVVEDGQHDHLDVGVFLLDDFRGFDAIHLRHLDVHENHVEVVIDFQLSDQFSAICGLHFQGQVLGKHL